MISDFKQIEILFEEINHNLKSKVHVYLIGGVVLLYQELKPATKDIDLIILKKQEFVTFEQALKATRFETKIPTDAYKKMNLSQIYIRNDFRIDAFHETVCRKFSLSKEMKNER